MDNKKILVVDDEEMLLLFINDFLSHHNYSVTVCTDAGEALEIIKSSIDEFDLIITDQAMPKMTGLELVKQVREINNNIPIILCSGYNDVVDENEMKAYQISFFLQKPVDNSQMLKCVSELL